MDQAEFRKMCMRLETVYCQRRGNLERCFPEEIFKAAWAEDIVGQTYVARLPREEEMRMLWLAARHDQDRKDLVDLLTEHWFWTYNALLAAMRLSEGVE